MKAVRVITYIMAFVCLASMVVSLFIGRNEYLDIIVGGSGFITVFGYLAMIIDRIN